MSVESAVLTRFLISPATSVSHLRSAGGFSGASIWKVETSSGPWCLKSWPAGISRERLERIHRWMSQARVAGLRFVPTVAETIDRATVVEAVGRLWDLCGWMPGEVESRSHPNSARIEAACVGLARLHNVWRAGDQAVIEPASLQRRIQAAAEWLTLVDSGWRPQFAPAELDPVTEAAHAAWAILPRLVPTVGPSLAPWAGRAMPLHPCLCDVWGDHVLFIADEVAGIIDYGSMRLDHPAADLARILGDLAATNSALYDTGLVAYGRVAPLSSDDALLVRALDRTGTILAATRWLLRIYRDGEQFHDRERVARRLRDVVGRILRDGVGYPS